MYIKAQNIFAEIFFDESFIMLDEFSGTTKGGLEGAQAPPSLKKVCPIIRPDPMTFY